MYRKGNTIGHSGQKELGSKYEHEAFDSRCDGGVDHEFLAEETRRPNCGYHRILSMKCGGQGREGCVIDDVHFNGGREGRIC